ncbi:hypothetical protein A374_19365 [Fictibacillus macauensis ZFHKF-1]|uniref:Uncharacterized protein n=1 Tax=Fictibacillus macauensis ZFHKF-1 TaxID=1196324 RepID=I8IW46_9BACL|nr:hypothetical protein [Fictibacillus macauensis]EIT83711.1 hypothetical protein A374_19365 [Fictibacillus macauensis ZFHKF-1]
MKRKVSSVLKWITGGLELVLGIPYIGGIIVVSLFWTPLVVMLILHLLTLLFSDLEKTNKHASIVGIISSCIGWIPFVGMMMHLITANLLFVDAAQEKKTQSIRQQDRYEMW